MIIKSVAVSNFRSVRAAELRCDRLTALVGRNGAGKSSFLHALEYFYDVSAPVNEEDFFDRKMENPIEIRVTFGELSKEEATEFQAYVSDGNLAVTKRISAEQGRFAARYYASTPQVPTLADIRAMPGRRDKTTRWNELVEEGTLTGERAKSAEQLEGLMIEFEQAHPELLEPIEREDQFFGARNVGGGKLDKYTKFVLVPAIKEVQQELQGRKGVFEQILDTIVLRKLAEREDIRRFRESVSAEARAVFSPDNLGELPETAESITRTLQQFAPGAVLNLSWGDVIVPDILPPPAHATLVEDAFEGEVGRKGHGLQRALIMTLLQYLASIGTPPVAGSDSASSDIGLPTLILGIEEPELYLHPSRARHLAGVLLRLASSGGDNQVLYTTHSPQFVDMERFDQIRVVQKRVKDTGEVPESTVRQYSHAEAAAEMARISAADPSKFTRDTFRIRAIPVMSALVNEGFFAEATLVVEGPSELGVFWRLQELRGMRWSERGGSIILANGKNSIDRAVVIFRGLSIPTFFVFDGDANYGGSERQSALTSNQRLLRLAGVPPEDFPETQVHPNWAVFRDNLETTIEEAAGSEDFHGTLQSLAEELGFESPNRVIKNSEGAARVITALYEKGKSLPALEQIVDAVSLLLPS